MEMQGRFADGARWLDWPGVRTVAAVIRPNGFSCHLGWHQALFALESLDRRDALALFDRYLDPRRSEITLQRVDAASLLWRAALVGVDVGDRWQRLLDGWSLPTPTAPGCRASMTSRSSPSLAPANANGRTL